MTEESRVEPAFYEKIAKAISFQLKAAQDIEMFNQDRQRSEALTKTQDYENLSPPDHEERQRLIEKLTALYNRINGAS